MKKCALVVIDTDNWVFARIAQALMRHCKRWRICAASMCAFEGCSFNEYERMHKTQFNAVLWLPDWRTDLIVRAKIPRDKMILAVRCDVFRKDDRTNRFYSDAECLHNVCVAIAAANWRLFSLMKKIHPKTYWAPGGVDTEKFKPKDAPWHDPIAVGWAGSEKNQGRESRGLDMIEEACKRLNLDFNPAFREDRWRTEDEMVAYYQNEIDIYVDAHDIAGRQNGLLEAAACGKVCVATRTGISEELIETGKDGFLCERTVPAITGALFAAISTNKRHEIIQKMREKTEKDWSWQRHAGIFERMFDDVG